LLEVLNRIDDLLAESGVLRTDPEVVPTLIPGTVRTFIVDEPSPLGRTAAALSVSASVMAQTTGQEQRDPYLYRCISEVTSWLGVTLVDLAPALGIGRATVYAWRSRGSSPRPKTVRAVLRVHSMVDIAVRANGVDATRAWFHAGSPSPLDQILKAGGDTLRLSALAREVQSVFAPLPAYRPDPNLAARRRDEPVDEA
jgi:hypothetical protein